MFNSDRRRRRIAGLSVVAALVLGLSPYLEHTMTAAIQALAIVAAGGTGRSALASGSLLYGLGTAPVGLVASPGDNTKALCGSNPPAFGVTCAGGGISGGGITVFSASALAIAAGTYYFPIGGGATPSGTETAVDTDSPTAATITNFYAQLSVALGMGNTGVFTWRKNGVSQSVTCTITGAVATSCNDTTHSFSVVAGDLLTIQLVTTGTIVVTPGLVMSVQFGTTGSNGTVNAGTAGQVTYYPAIGTAVSGATVSGAVKAGNPPTQAACADLSNGGVGCTAGGPAGLNSEWQARLNATTYQAVTGTSVIPLTGWTIVNAAVFNNFSASRIGIFVSSNAATNWRLITRALPGGTTYTVAATVQCMPAVLAVSTDECSIGLGDGTKYSLMEFDSAAANPGRLVIENLTNATTFSATAFGPTGGLTPRLLSVCVTENNTNRTWFHYSNGAWVQDLQVATGNFLTPTTLAVGGISVGSGTSGSVESDLVYLFTSTSAACP